MLCEALTTIDLLNEVADLFDRLEIDISAVLEDIESHRATVYGLVSKQQYKILQKKSELLTLKVSASVDWEEQWRSFAPNYKEGVMTCDLSTYGYHANDNTFMMKVGSGFGDLSHPTTRLMLHLMCYKVKNKHVLDLGCGSGVLSLAAYRMGANSIEGVDIDKQALEHARENKLLNQYSNVLSFSLYSQSIEKPSMLLMNMIRSEQVRALESIQSFLPNFNEMIISGMLQKEQKAFFNSDFLHQWTLVEMKEEEEWLGYYFCRN